MIRNFIRLALAAAFGAPLLALHATAATTDAGASAGLEEIVVTATRREERLQDVPVSVSAFSQEKLDAEGLKNIDDLVRLSPGVTFQRNAMSSSGNYNDEGSDINFRGIDSTAGTSTTGIYIDDTPIQTRHIGFGSINPFPELFDLDRVEVLRGPQGTLFGAGAEGGVLRFIAPQPSLTTASGYVRADVATTKGGGASYEAGVAMGGPIINDVLGFRLSASFRRDGGWVDRVGYTVNSAGFAVNDGDLVESKSNWSHTASARAALTWKPADGLEITPSVFFQELHINDTSAYWISLSNPGGGTYNNGNLGTNPSTDPFTLSAIKVKWDLPFAELISNTSYFARDQHGLSDYSQYIVTTYLGDPYPPSPSDYATAIFEDKQSNFYEEIRLSSIDKDARVTWSAGLFYSHLNENVNESVIDPSLNGLYTAAYGVPLCNATFQCPGGTFIDQNPINRVVDTQIAGFGEVGFKLTDTVTATVGLRVSHLKFVGSIAGPSEPFFGPAFTGSQSSSENPVTPKAVLTWQPDRDNMVYVSAAKGFRPGGVNFPIGGSLCTPSLSQVGLSSIPGQYSSDSLWSYEIGTKNTFLDHTLQVDVSIFSIDWKNIQTNYYLLSCGEAFNANLGNAKSGGGEIEMTYKPVEQFTISATAAYTDAKYSQTSCIGALTWNGSQCAPVGATPALPLVSAGDRLLGAPWSFTASSEIHLPDWQGRKPYVRVDYQYTTAQTALIARINKGDGGSDPTLPGLPVATNLSMRAGIRFSGFDLSVYGNNLTNAHPLMFESRDIPFTGENLYFGRGVRPLTFGVTGTYRY
jgi:iron complex outermembrane recepter protein